MHVFAFSWKGYNISKFSDDPVNAPGLGFSGQPPQYQGGWLGIKAYADAFNPWDILKATARGFRWLFVGRRHRFEDASYKNVINPANKPGNLDGSNSDSRLGSLPRTQADGTATEMVPSTNTRIETETNEDDTAGLLANAHNVFPSRPGHFQQAAGDLSLQHSHYTSNSLETPMPSAYGGYDDAAMHPDFHANGTDTGYHAPTAAPSSNGPIGAAYGGQSGEWDMWAGATRQDHPNSSSRR